MLVRVLLIPVYSIDDCRFLPHAPVGVFRYTIRGVPFQVRLPHACGGVSLFSFRDDTAGKSSPLAWGCFTGTPAETENRMVFPTLVGVS